MKGLPTLAVLVLGAAAAGFLLYGGRRSKSGGDPALPPVTVEAFIEEATGLKFQSPPGLLPLPEAELVERIGAHLDRRFGPDGLTARARALALLGLLPPGTDLRRQLTVAESAGARGWFDNLEGTICVLDDFDQSDLRDRAVLHGLQTRALLHQHAPVRETHPGDDPWIARRGIHGAIAASVEARFRADHPAELGIPTSAQTEREAILLGLPVYVHNLAQFHVFQATDFLRARVADDPASLPNLVRRPPRNTHQILGGDPATTALPPLPARGEPRIEESLGAFAVLVLGEWLATYEDGQALAGDWRGDRYRLWGAAPADHLLWRCRWVSETAARNAATVLGSLTEPTAPAVRHTRLVVQGSDTLFLNCADPETLEALLAAVETPGSPPANHP